MDVDNLPDTWDERDDPLEPMGLLDRVFRFSGQDGGQDALPADWEHPRLKSPLSPAQRKKRSRDNNTDSSQDERPESAQLSDLDDETEDERQEPQHEPGLRGGQFLSSAQRRANAVTLERLKKLQADQQLQAAVDLQFNGKMVKANPTAARPRQSLKTTNRTETLAPDLPKKVRKRKEAGKHIPPELQPGAIAQLKPESCIVLIFSVDRDPLTGRVVVRVCHTGYARFSAHEPDELASVQRRYLKRFWTSGLVHRPHASTVQSWTWWYVIKQERYEPVEEQKQDSYPRETVVGGTILRTLLNDAQDTLTHAVQYCEESSAMLTAAYRMNITDHKYNLFLPRERHSVLLYSIFGMFAVNDPGPDEYAYKYQVLCLYDRKSSPSSYNK